MLDFLEQLVRIETPSHNPASQEKIFKFITNKLYTLDYHVMRFPGIKTGGYLIARPEQRKRYLPIQLMIGHCDTVWELEMIKQLPINKNNGQMNGPGVFDMKAGLTQMIFSIQAIRELHLNIHVTPVLLINSDEEIGSRESTTAIRRLSNIANRAFVLEPPLGLDGKLKTARKGLGRFTITITGKPAHAGLDPESGASAIVELSHQIQQLFALNDPIKGITVNVGMIEGGVSPNVIAPKSKAVVDVRVLTAEDGDYIQEAILKLKPINPETKLHIEGKIGRPPMEKTTRNIQLWNLAKNVANSIGLDLEESTAGGGSDGNTTSMYTATLDGLGTVGDGAHAHHEYILTHTMIERSALLTLLLLEEPLINYD